MFEGLFQPFHLLVILFFFVPLVIPAVFYLVTLQKVLARCSEQSRTVSPQSVWLMLIPIFNFVYHFILVNAIARSLRTEFSRRGIAVNDPEPGKSLGIAMCLLHIGAMIPMMGVLFALAGITCWILYWVKIADYSGMIALHAAGAQVSQSLT